MKSGAPTMAVTAPTGTSVGQPRCAPELSSHYDGNGAADGGGWQQSAMIGAKHEAHRVRHEQADVTDTAADRNRQSVKNDAAM